MIPSPHSQGIIAGRYSIRRRLGSGSLGTVYLAHDRRVDRTVALKVLRTDRLSADTVERFQREFGAIASLRHPQIAAAFDFGYAERSVPYYTREFIEGAPLAAGPPPVVPPGEFLRPILDLLDALEYLHAHGILHLDIHPGNVIQAADASRGSVLIDFGLFRPEGGPEPSLSSRSLPALPPEVLRSGRLEPATDLHLAGRLLLYRLTGDPAAEAPLPREVPGWGARLALEIERIAAKAVEPEPRRRFRSAGEFREAIRRALGAERAPAIPREPPAATIGRARETARIEEGLRDALTGKARVLCLLGLPGMGKTRLLADARLRSQILGLEAVEVRCFPDPGPSSPLLAALRSAGQKRRKLPEWMEPLEAAHGGTPQERAGRAARAFFEEEEMPLALLLDDLDRAGPETRVLVSALLREARERRTGGAPGRGLCLLAAMEKRTSKDFEREEVIPLRPLARHEARRLLLLLARPLAVPEGLTRMAVARAGGSPLKLRRIALALRAEWGRAERIPPGAELPEGPTRDRIAAGLGSLESVSEEGREALGALAVLGSPARGAELAAALALEPRQALRRLRDLEREEHVLSIGRGAGRLFQLSSPEDSERLRAALPPEEVQSMRLRAAGFLSRRSSVHPRGPRFSHREAECLARLLLGGGRRSAGLRQALRAASGLRRAGHHQRAITLLEEAFPAAASAAERSGVLKELGSILEEIGDHEKGLALLEPLHRRRLEGLSPREAIRILRQLGVHYHRAGRAEEAAAVFREAERRADPRRDLEDLVFMDSELAELHTLRGELPRAEEACRRGLERLGSLKAGDPFRDRMEVILRASQGHLDLRRVRLPEACEEFRAALSLSRKFRMPAVRAVAFNNLGIALNQLNRYREARQALLAAERLYLEAGERRSLVLIAANLAVIAARLGEREEAAGQLERASHLLRRSPGERLELAAHYARGMAALLLGDAEAALEALLRALVHGERLGDQQLVRHGKVHLAEAQVLCGRLGEAHRALRALARELAGEENGVLSRLVHSRLLLVETLLGRPREVQGSRDVLARIPPGPLPLLEGWNDIFRGLAALMAGEPSAGLFQGSLQTFRRLGVRAGERSARLGLLLEALFREDPASAEKLARPLEEAGPEPHRFLAVARPIVLAEACLLRGDLERARERLSEASGAIIGTPFLELDWRIEFLRARLAQRVGQVHEARAHLHRALHARELLTGLLPARARDRFLSHPRFRGLQALAARLERSPRLAFGSRAGASGLPFEGLVGGSMPMLRVFQAIDRLRDQEAPVLVTGETGTGKELVARALHRSSPRATGPFFPLHAASLPVELFESELFGHEAGAFTGAGEAREGLLEGLRGGTLLLDEVGELPPGAQAKLLRVLAAGKIRRLGGTEERPIDVRFIASAGADLRERVRSGAFREDLYWRLAALEVRLPPLRERKEDVEPLARHFLALHARRLDRPVPGLAPAALGLLKDHSWPGNVRELEGVLLRALATHSPGGRAGAGAIGAEELAGFLGAGRDSLSEEEEFQRALLSGEPSLDDLHRRLERIYLIRLFRRARGDLRGMMEALGLKRSHLYDRLRAAGLDIRSLRGSLERR